MRNPVRYRNINTCVTLACALTLGTLYVLSLQKPTPPWVIVTATVVLMLCLISLIAAIMYGVAARGRRKLLAGEGILAQWMVDPQTWLAFVADNDHLNKKFPPYENALQLTPNPPADGVEVILGERAVIVDGDYQDLPTHSHDLRFRVIELQEGQPSQAAHVGFVNIHLDMTYRTRYASRTIHYALRFPVPEASRQDAANVINWYRACHQAKAARSGTLPQLYPRQTRAVGLVMMLLAGVVGAAGIYCMNEPQLVTADVATGVVITCSVVMALGLLFAFVGNLHCRRQQKALPAAPRAAPGFAPGSAPGSASGSGGLPGGPLDAPPVNRA